MSAATVSIFRYSMHPHERRHGPQGYEDPQSYKPWLRDEFSFRCAYCLCREAWFPDGDASFSVDHFIPRTTHPEGATDYDNLVYACCQCNRLKQGATDLLNPWTVGLGEHLFVRDDGTILGTTPAGVEFVAACGLDRLTLTTFRRGMLDLWHLLAQRKGAQAMALRRQFFGFPDTLPCLAQLRPPGGNRRPNGLLESSFERQQREELPELY